MRYDCEPGNLRNSRGMGSTLKLALTDELRAFVDRNSGDGTLYVTAGEFVRHVLREKEARLEAARIRDAILAGYQDALNGRTVAYRGDLPRLLKKAQDGGRPVGVLEVILVPDVESR